MTFEEIKAKIETCDSISITEIKEIQYGKCICLSNDDGKVKKVDEVALSLIRELSRQGYKIDTTRI